MERQILVVPFQINFLSTLNEYYLEKLSACSCFFNMGRRINNVCATIKIFPTTQYSARAAGKKNAKMVIIIGIIYSMIFICGLSDAGLSAIISFCCKKVAAPATNGKIGSVEPSSNHRKLPVLMASVRIIA